MIIAEYDLSGTVAFVTGAGRGIGKGIAQVLAEAGAEVVINSLTERYVTGLAADIAKATGRRIMPLVADVTRSDEAERAVGRILAEFGALHVLVNNLGDSIRKPLVPRPGADGDSAPLTDEELRAILDVNLTATVLCSRAVGPHMLARGSGKVINIGSSTSPGTTVRGERSSPTAPRRGRRSSRPAPSSSAGGRRPMGAAARRGRRPRRARWP